ncbi:MAG: hypothetical protein WCC57_02735 [Paracoccaceae bacterium]
MTQWKLMGSTAFVALIAGSAAMADVTAEEVWQSWKDLGTSYGQTLAVESEVRDGDTLTITNLSLTTDQDGTKVEITIPEVLFTENGDGAVEVTMSEEIPVVITTTKAEAGEPSEVTVLVSNPDMVMTVSGTAEELRNDYEASSIKVALSELKGGDSEKVDVTAEVTMTGLTGSSITKGATDKVTSGTFGAASVAANIAVKDGETNGNFNMVGTFADLAGNATTSLPAATDMKDIMAALKAGFATEGAFTYGKSDVTFDFADAESNAKGTGGTEGGSFNFAMDQARLNYGGSAKGAFTTISGSDIPFPELTVKYAEAAFNLLVPVGKSDGPSDFALLTKFVDLSVSDEVWAMFDPALALPRDPITVVLDTKGTAKLNVDLMDTAAMEALAGGAPGELNSLDVTALQVKVAGAELTGAGALTFDNTDLVTFDGMPTPTGVIEMKLTGANGLLDKLATMGLIPEDQLMGGRMMLGMFAKVVEGEPDTMTSTLEFKDKGFFANGMQLK